MFLHLGVALIDGDFVYKPFDQRDEFSFLIVRMQMLKLTYPHPSSIGLNFLNFSRIARVLYYYRTSYLGQLDYNTH